MEELTDEQCDRIVALTMDKLAAKHNIHALDLNADITTHDALRRSIVRAAYVLGTSQAKEACAKLCEDNQVAMSSHDATLIPRLDSVGRHDGVIYAKAIRAMKSCAG